MPVTAPPLSELCVGMSTTSGTMLPAPSYSVDTPLPLSAIQTGPKGLKAMPQALMRLGSVWSAGTAPSETRLCCWYLSGIAMYGDAENAGAEQSNANASGAPRRASESVFMVRVLVTPRCSRGCGCARECHAERARFTRPKRHPGQGLAGIQCQGRQIE